MMASFVGGTPPGPYAGDMSPVTEALRPRISLDAKQAATARRLRRDRWTIGQIAEHLEADQEEVRHALATLRTKKMDPHRRTLNVTVEAAEFVSGQAEPGEAVWQTMDRLLVELVFSRALLAGRGTRPVLP